MAHHAIQTQYCCFWIQKKKIRPHVMCYRITWIIWRYLFWIDFL